MSWPEVLLVLLLGAAADRSRRTLLFQENSVAQLDIGFKLLWMEYPVGSLSNNCYYKLQFPLPYNASELRTALSSRRARGESRMRVYASLESALQQLRFPGRACLLRSICEAAEVPLASGRPEHLLEELLHILLT